MIVVLWKPVRCLWWLVQEKDQEECYHVLKRKRSNKKSQGLASGFHTLTFVHKFYLKNVHWLKCFEHTRRFLFVEVFLMNLNCKLNKPLRFKICRRGDIALPHQVSCSKCCFFGFGLLKFIYSDMAVTTMSGCYHFHSWLCSGNNFCWHLHFSCDLFATITKEDYHPRRQLSLNHTFFTTVHICS